VELVTNLRRSKVRIPKISLIWKLVGINLLGVGIVILLAWQVIDHFAADYFMSLMKQYNIDPKVLHQMFLHTTHQFLLLSMLLGLGVVSLLGFFMTKQVMGSLTQMSRVTQKLALGDYSERIKITTNDEIGEMGHAFNHMVESLEKIEKMRKDLVANVAHELRTPLNNIRGELEAIQDRLLEPSPKTIDSLHEEVLRLVRLVEALQRLSQIDAEIQVLTKKRFDLDAVVFQLLQKEQPRFDQKGIRLKIEGEPLFVVADLDQIIQVVQNLIQNILQYTPGGGEAGVHIKKEENRAKVKFTNSGEGIREEDLPHIFERFFRAEKSRSREWGGAGIGLSIVKQIVEAHGGSVGANSKPGKTEIWFTLPF
jgi:two-component system sensor histidine kinase BaeS